MGLSLTHCATIRTHLSKKSNSGPPTVGVEEEEDDDEGFVIFFALFICSLWFRFGFRKKKSFPFL